MALDFPSNPTIGQRYEQWVWSGERWIVETGFVNAIFGSMLVFREPHYIGRTQVPTDERFPEPSISIWQVSAAGGTNQNYPRSGVLFSLRPLETLYVYQLLIPTNNAAGTGPTWRTGNIGSASWEPFRKLYDGNEP